MGHQIDLGAWNAVFAVPTVLVDRHLKLAGKEQLQVILWLLRHGGEVFTEDDLCAALNLDRDTVMDALEYWTGCGLLAADGERLFPSPAAAEPQAAALPDTEAGKGKVQQALPPSRRMPRPDSQYLAIRMQESEKIRFLMQEAETILGKALSPALSSALLSICDDYGLPVEVIVMILNYVKDVGKTSTAYIESVARDWAQSGVFTLDAAEDKLRQLSERRQAWGKVQSAAGLPRRSPTKKEEEAAFRWVKEWGFSPEMLAGAYERCADNTGKFSVGYMNKILERWHKMGLTNPQQVADEEQLKQAEQAHKKSYDIDELERISFFAPPEEL